MTLASVRIRCEEIAIRLACDRAYGIHCVDDIPRHYRAFVCVKPALDTGALATLAKRGIVIWDVLDSTPPQSSVDVYLTSTRAAARMITAPGRRVVIHHYHCNIERRPRLDYGRRIGYVGNEHWYPTLSAIPHDRYFVHGWTRQQVVAAYQGLHIALNLRRTEPVEDRFLPAHAKDRPDHHLHVACNSGIKLINCIGFGLPSVSACEPAYSEIGNDCTMFSDLQTYPSAVAELQHDDDRYQRIVSACRDLEPCFHIDAILDQYRRLVASL